ncbi:hypothetical protein HanOQP8_Chr10g0363801 [Helianthus annuus]|nr:hypothetical protein HanOQP8_Chr10g0363801 [Helianthus annuus]
MNLFTQIFPSVILMFGWNFGVIFLLHLLCLERIMLRILKYPCYIPFLIAVTLISLLLSSTEHASAC